MKGLQRLQEGTLYEDSRDRVAGIAVESGEKKKVRANPFVNNAVRASRRRKIERKKENDQQEDNSSKSIIEVHLQSAKYDDSLRFGHAVKNGLQAGARHYRIRNFGRSFGSHCHHSDHGVSPETSRAMGCDSAGNLRSVGADRKHKMMSLRDLIEECVSKLEIESGQSTVEYAVVLTAFLGVIVAIGLLSGFLRDGLFIQHAISAASHNVEVILGGAADVFSY